MQLCRLQAPRIRTAEACNTCSQFLQSTHTHKTRLLPAVLVLAAPGGTARQAAQRMKKSRG